MNENPMKENLDAELSIQAGPEMAQKMLQVLCNGLSEKCAELERALLWVIYEQCTYGGKAYAKLLIHGEEAFRAVGLKDGCDEKEIEERLFLKSSEK